MIQTVTGAITRDRLGRVLSHEHLLINLSVFAPPPADKSIPYNEKLSLSNLRYVRKDPYLILDNAIMDETDTAIEEMKLFKAAGGGTVVDATLDAIGRDPLALRRISEESGVNIVMGSGFYVAAAHPAYVRERTERELAEEILCDLTEGVRGTGIRAGMIGEIGTSATVTPEEWKCVAAAGIAQRESGKAVHIHTSLYERNGIAIADKLLAMGVPPQKLCIDHIDVDIREDYIKQLLDKGIYVEFDNFGKEYYISKREGNALNGRFAYDLERAQTIARLLDAGYGKQILLCNDICLKNMLCRYGGFGYAHILQNIRPMLGDCGVSDAQIEAMLTSNCADFLDDGGV